MQLYINTYGTYVHIKDKMFEIQLKKDGKQEKHYLASHKVSSIILPRGTAISTDAIHLALKNNIDIVIAEKDGYPIGRIWHSKLGSTTKIRKRQLEVSLDKDAIRWVKQWIGQKLQNQVDFIKDLKKHRIHLVDYLQDKADNIKSLGEKLLQLKADNINDIADTIRGLEGTAGRLYFETMSYVLPKDYQFNGRSSRPAKDPFNAFLNYAYGILYSKVEKVLIIAGLDPYLGFLHRDDYNQKSLVFDYIEPYRIYAEIVVFHLFSGKKVNKSHTDEITNGYSLNDKGKPLLIEAFTKYMEEDKIRYKGRNQTRSNAMQMDAHQFANELIKEN